MASLDIGKEHFSTKYYNGDSSHYLNTETVIKGIKNDIIAIKYTILKKFRIII